MKKDDPLYRELPDSFDEPARPPLPAAPPPPPGRCWTVTIGATLWLGVTFLFFFSFVPKFDEVYSQVHVDMPDPTQALLAVSRAACAFPILSVALGLLYPWWMGRPSSSRFGRISRTLGALIPFLLCAWMVWALFLPLMSCTLRMGSGR